jgi:hypothetical protein
MEEKQPDQVIIYCGMHGLYERAEHNGYTNDPRKAGIYERSKVQDLVGSPYSERKNELLPVPEDHETRIAERIASLTAERDALAAQNLELRGALEKWQAHMAMGEKPAEVTLGEIRATLAVAENDTHAALSLPLPAAAERVRVEREYCDAALEWTNRGPFKWEDYERFCAADTALRAARGGK